MKRILKTVVIAILGWQVRRLRAKNDFQIIGVVGSYGKTSTKLAIAKVLEAEFDVLYQQGNYNDTVSVPLVFFEQGMPSLYNPIAWIKVFATNEKKLKKIFPYSKVVVELGIDGPGQMKKFADYLKLDIAVVTALSAEHMEYFSDIDHAAAEELRVAKFSRELLINQDLCQEEYWSGLDVSIKAYRFEGSRQLPLKRWKLIVSSPSREKHEQVDETELKLQADIISRSYLYSLNSAAAVALEFDISPKKIQSKINTIKPFPGRMNILPGKKSATIIDDTYNSNPDASKLALDTLYAYPAKQRLALLGQMNELGKFSEQMHREVGQYCNPNRLDTLVTLGSQANLYLADEAERAGCKVIRTDSPGQAGRAIEKLLKPDTVVLAKGSQNGVFAEEAIKSWLANIDDKKHLVRQSRSWLARKQTR